MFTTKKEIRLEMARRKRALSVEHKSIASECLCRQLLSDRKIQKAEVLLLYNALPDEISLAPLLDFLYKKENPPTLLLPIVKGEELELKIYQGLNSLQIGAYGILEPTGEVFTEYSNIEIAIIPGVAFNQSGIRVGRGKGFYDRLLPHLTEAYKIGVCFPCQLIGDLPSEPHDVPMNTVIVPKD